MKSREEHGEQKELLTIQSVIPHIMEWAFLAASETGFLVFIDCLTADKSRRMNYEL